MAGEKSNEASVARRGNRVPLALTAPPAAAQGEKVLIYSGTTGYRHSSAGEAIQPAVVDLIQSKLLAAGIASDYRSCNGQGTGAGTLPGCRNATVGNPAIFTAANLAQYDAIFFWQASSRNRDDTTGQRLFTDAEQAAIEEFARAGGGIAAMHASVTMGAGQVTWPWWDAPGDSAIGALMPGHSATDANNIATVQVSDRNHPSTRDLPDSYRFGDEHYTFSSNPRGTHHVLMTLDEESYTVGSGHHLDGRRPPDRVVPDVPGRRSGPRASGTSPPPTWRTAATTT